MHRNRNLRTALGKFNHFKEININQNNLKFFLKIILDTHKAF